MEYNIALFRALPILFPSPAAPPKMLEHASEALSFSLEPPISTFAKENLDQGLLYVIAYCYTLHIIFCLSF